MGITVYYPKLSLAHYHTLSSEPNLNLPDTYNEWLNLAHKEMREIILAGDRPCEIEIDPDEFAEFCHSEGKARTFGALREFATKKGSD
jgi:hypothetical protein